MVTAVSRHAVPATASPKGIGPRFPPRGIGPLHRSRLEIPHGTVPESPSGATRTLTVTECRLQDDPSRSRREVPNIGENTGTRETCRSLQTRKLSPQPQVSLAFGFSKVKPEVKTSSR